MGRSSLKRRRARALVLREPPRKDSRTFERFGIYMLFGMLLLGIYGQYAGRGPGESREPVRQQAPVYHFETQVVRAQAKDKPQLRGGQAGGDELGSHGRLQF